MKIIIILAALLLAGCTRPESAAKALEDAGYSNINISGYASFSCGNDDTFATHFTAKGPTGRDVSGAVCEGMFKSKTIRLD